MAKPISTDPKKIAEQTKKEYALATSNPLTFLDPYGYGRDVGIAAKPGIERAKEVAQGPVNAPTGKDVKESFLDTFRTTSTGNRQREHDAFVEYLKKRQEQANQELKQQKGGASSEPVDMGEVEYDYNPKPAGALGGGAKAYASGHFNVAAPLLEQTFHKNPNAATALMAAMAHQRNGNEERAQKLHMQALMHHEAGQGQLTPAQIEHARENAHPDHLVHFDNKVSVQNAIKNMATRMEAQGVHPQEAIRMATSQVFDHLGSGPIVQGIQAMKPLYNEPMNITAEPRAGAQGPVASPPETFVHYGAPAGPNPDAMQITARRPMMSAPSPGIQEVAPRTMNNPPGHKPITAPHAARIYNEDK